MQSLHIETGFPIFIYWKIIHFVRQRCVHGQALLDWPFGVGQKAANPQGDQKLNTKAILISQFVKHTHVLDKIQIGQLYRFSSTSALPKGWNLAARSCLESAQQVLIIENHLKSHSWFFCKNAMYATLHLFRQSIWGIIWRLTLEKNRANAKYATLNLFRQCIWGIIWNHLETNRTNAMHATLTLYEIENRKNAMNAISRRASAASAEGGRLETFKAPHRDPWWPGAIIYNCNECNFKTSYYTNLTIHDNITINSSIILNIWRLTKGQRIGSACAWSNLVSIVRTCQKTWTQSPTL